ncbi:DEAD/DEAH box helicase [Methylobacterium sp. J-001]|uniref:DEAD/DEAH box helicase n=1 Tax=Methylobacterium sp. J-001 TaxID=2836609 RepID=UPI001FBB315D|nr:DEAD/DEAH box helicase [Methylobacterium sp. J-001]MCJ2116624.1 DEAD/DEAH box helicase [Methylobacterium sp. J-001]
MNASELIEWLLNDGVARELATLVRINALQDLENVDPVEAIDDALEQLDWKRLLLAGSILAKSKARRPREAALLIATSAMTCAPRGPIRDASALLFEQLSNRVAVDLAQRKAEFGTDLDSRLGVGARLELTRNRLRNSVVLEASGSLMEVNEFQHDFWTAAKSAAWLSASAPTASGKTFLVVQWIIDQVRSQRVRTVIYLAPTRALVSETEANLKGMLGKSDTDPYAIQVSSLPSVEKYVEASRDDAPLILVFTQERFHLFANTLHDQVKIDLLIVDEAHKIGDVRRGVVLQDAVERALRASPAVRAVFISPATHNPETLLEDAPAGRELRVVDSDAPTVLQNVIFAQQVRKQTKKYHLSVRSGDRPPRGGPRVELVHGGPLRHG